MRTSKCSLCAFVLRLGSVLDPASVMHGNGVLFGDLIAGAGLELSLVNTHDVG